MGLRFRLVLMAVGRQHPSTSTVLINRTWTGFGLDAVPLHAGRVAPRVSAVHRASRRSRASYFVLVFDRTQLPEGSVPGPAHPVTDDELRDVVSRYWVVDDIRNARIHGNLPPDFGGLPGVELRDEPKGRKSIAAWLLSAHLD